MRRRWGTLIAVSNPKGGVSKTNIVGNIGTLAATKQKEDGEDIRVLIVDLDHQNHLTQLLGFHDLEPKETLAHHLSRDDDLTPIVKKNVVGIRGLDLIPSHDALVYSDRQALESTLWLRRMIKPLSIRYDIILFDCPGDLEVFTKNAIVASDGVLIPTQAKKYSVEGIPNLMTRARHLAADADKKCPWFGVLLTQIMPNKQDETWTSMIRQAFGDIVFQSRIRWNTDIEKAVAADLPLFCFDQKCAGFVDYTAATEELLGILEAYSVSPSLEFEVAREI